RCKLAVEQLRRHEVTAPRAQSLQDQVARAFQVYQPYVGALSDQDVAIGALQSRAGDGEVCAGFARSVDLFGDGPQPGPAIVVGKRVAAAHLRDIAGGVEFVAILETPAKASSERPRDRGLARSGNTHHEQCVERFCNGVFAHAASPAAARSTSQVVRALE